MDRNIIQGTKFGGQCSHCLWNVLFALQGTDRWMESTETARPL